MMATRTEGDEAGEVVSGMSSVVGRDNVIVAWQAPQYRRHGES